MKRSTGLSFAALLALDYRLAFSHEGHKASSARAEISREVQPWGQEGDPRKAIRTIAIDMSDTMRFSPAQIKVWRWSMTRPTWLTSNRARQRRWRGHSAGRASFAMAVSSRATGKPA